MIPSLMGIATRKIFSHVLASTTRTDAFIETGVHDIHSSKLIGNVDLVEVVEYMLLLLRGEAFHKG